MSKSVQIKKAINHILAGVDQNTQAIAALCSALDDGEMESSVPNGTGGMVLSGPSGGGSSQDAILMDNPAQSV